MDPIFASLLSSCDVAPPCIIDDPNGDGEQQLEASLADIERSGGVIDKNSLARIRTIENRISQVEEPVRSQFVGLISEVSKKPSALRVQPLFEDRVPQESDSYQSVGIEPNSPQLQPETSASGPSSKLTPDEQTSDSQTPGDRQASSQVDALIR